MLFGRMPIYCNDTVVFLLISLHLQLVVVSPDVEREVVDEDTR